MTAGLRPVTLVLGGARSGKSAFAERMLEAEASSRLYLATGQAWDDEMRARIEAHQDRRGQGWETVEAPVDLTGTLEANARADRPVLVDCLTLWVTNLMLGEHDIDAAFAGSPKRCRASRARWCSFPMKSAWASCRTMPWRARFAIMPAASTRQSQVSPTKSISSPPACRSR
jgi:adenosyl cobinamide kinase/adenosyl cobinamide phosphate guanylyltransferase